MSKPMISGRPNTGINGDSVTESESELEPNKLERPLPSQPRKMFIFTNKLSSEEFNSYKASISCPRGFNHRV